MFFWVVAAVAERFVLGLAAATEGAFAAWFVFLALAPLVGIAFGVGNYYLFG